MASNPTSSGAQSLCPPAVGSMAPQNFGPPFPMQFCPPAPTPHGQPFIPPSANQQFHPVGQTHVGLLPGQSQPPQFSQPMLQFLPQSSQSGQTTPTSYAQPSVPIPSVVPQSQSTGPSPGVSYSSPYSAVNGLNTTQQTASDWQEYQAADGRRYFYNKVTKQSSWEKPRELMTPLERADASTVWKEFTTPEGRKYYYNTETKLSKWTIPDELKLAREMAGKEAAQGARTNSTAPAFSTGTSAEQLSAAVTTVSSTNTTMFPVSSTPVPVASITNTSVSPVMVSGSSATPTIHTAPKSADLFRNYLVDLQKKEKAKAQKEHQHNRLEFRKFLETCAFIKVDSQWRKGQDLLEDDERCRRLDKIDCLDIFQEYIRDLEKEEDEQKKRQKVF